MTIREQHAVMTVRSHMEGLVVMVTHYHPLGSHHEQVRYKQAGGMIRYEEVGEQGRYTEVGGRVRYEGVDGKVRYE